MSALSKYVVNGCNILTHKSLLSMCKNKSILLFSNAVYFWRKQFSCASYAARSELKIGNYDKNYRENG